MKRSVSRHPSKSGPVKDTKGKESEGKRERESLPRRRKR